MIPALRKDYNEHFTAEKYAAFIQSMATAAGEAPAFKVAETPVFVPAALTKQLVDTSEAIIDVITQADFKARSEASFPPCMKVPGENEHTHFVIIDFAVCKNAAGELQPQLIELQGFPSLYAFQELMAREFKHHFQIPDSVNNYFNGYNDSSYLALLKEIIVGPYRPEEVVLLEVKPHEQKTRIDFYYTEKVLGIPVVCITDLEQRGNQLYYKETLIKRIYNRVIFDDLQKQSAYLPAHVSLFQDFDVEWITHPNWFYRISKFILPFIKSEFAPESWFLHTRELPADLENYVLKPLFSFAGQGVVIDVTPEDIKGITDPENWILQRKVQYAPAIETPDGPAYCEIRMMYLWKDGASRPELVHNLARISKSKMIGVTKDQSDTWVGGSCAFFEQ